MTINNIEKIYYIQKEEFQLGTTTVYAPLLYTNYKLAKEEFIKLIKLEKESLYYLEKEIEAHDCIALEGIDKWGATKIDIYLRSGKVDERLII
ncbi:MAG: hypothetical protein RSB77_05395 [Bacilli bacterium]|uniref:hypothetical protein n=1 Tax=Cetobacterium sp. TaxID=2071632 RepID=UPI002FCAA1B7